VLCRLHMGLMLVGGVVLNESDWAHPLLLLVEQSIIITFHYMP